MSDFKKTMTDFCAEFDFFTADDLRKLQKNVHGEERAKIRRLADRMEKDRLTFTTMGEYYKKNPDQFNGREFGPVFSVDGVEFWADSFDRPAFDFSQKFEKVENKRLAWKCGAVEFKKAQPGHGRSTYWRAIFEKDGKKEIMKFYGLDKKAAIRRMMSSPKIWEIIEGEK